MAFKGNWHASKPMGLKVYNGADEKLGDKNEPLVDRSGKINAVFSVSEASLGWASTTYRSRWTS